MSPEPQVVCRQRRLVRLLLPLRDVEDAPAFARALEGALCPKTDALHGLERVP